MPNINILIKPASSACNMNCSYCFYKDEARNRSESFMGMLSEKKTEDLIKAACEYATGSCCFTFQGGEPTLAGLSYFENFVALTKKYAKPGLNIAFALQTNGLELDEKWAAFFSENHFLVGLSVDGPASVHNKNRPDNDGEGTCKRVLSTAALFDKYKVEYNILCVVTKETAQKIDKIYRFFGDKGYRWLQFIPCLTPIDGEDGDKYDEYGLTDEEYGDKYDEYGLTDEEYGVFLNNLFDLWYEDVLHGKYVSIRHFDNWMHIMLREEPELCSMTGRCQVQFVIEGNGDVYPCDFYVLDGWKLGNIGQNSLSEMMEGEIARRFVEESVELPSECKECKWLGLCRNGCRRDRGEVFDTAGQKTRFCEAHKQFFESRAEKMQKAVGMILSGVRR